MPHYIENIKDVAEFNVTYDINNIVMTAMPNIDHIIILKTVKCKPIYSPHKNELQFPNGFKLANILTNVLRKIVEKSTKNK